MWNGTQSTDFNLSFHPNKKALIIHCCTASNILRNIAPSFSLHERWHKNDYPWYLSRWTLKYIFSECYEFTALNSIFHLIILIKTKNKTGIRKHMGQALWWGRYEPGINHLTTCKQNACLSGSQTCSSYVNTYQKTPAAYSPLCLGLLNSFLHLAFQVKSSFFLFANNS